jgi:hypothetical protein
MNDYPSEPAHLPQVTCLQPATPLFTAMLPAPGPCCRHCGEVPPPVFVPRTWMGVSEVGLRTNRAVVVVFVSAGVDVLAAARCSLVHVCSRWHVLVRQPLTSHNVVFALFLQSSGHCWSRMLGLSTARRAH